MEQDLKEKVQKQEDKWEIVKVQNQMKMHQEQALVEDQEETEDLQTKNKSKCQDHVKEEE